MASNTRNTKLAIVQEVTEGTPVSPSVGTDYVALQDGGFELTPDFDLLQSAEIRGSIGAAKPTLGNENPSFSLDHYLKASGVEGQAPEDNLLIKSLLGSQGSRSTERSTTAGSTAGTSSARAVLALPANGSEFARGHFVLIKDGTNGYSIRPIYSVSGNNLTLGFNLSAAPASGVALGKDTRFSPTNSGHPSLSVWDYRGDGGAIQMISGLQAESMDITATAGDFVKASYAGTGTSFYYDPIEITSSNNKMDFSDGTQRNATITVGIYKDPIALAEEIEAKMDALTSDDITVSYSSTTGKFTISSDGATFSLLFATGTNTANTIAPKLGFTSTDHTAALTYTSESAIDLSSPVAPSYDSSSPLVAKDHVVFLGDFSQTTCVEEGVQEVGIKIAVAKPKTPDLCSVSGRSGSAANKRDASITLKLTMPQYDAQKFKNYRAGDSISFMYHFGTKSGGNWQPGYCGAVWIPDLVISKFSLGDADGVVTMELEGTAHVDSSGNGEIYIGYL